MWRQSIRNWSRLITTRCAASNRGDQDQCELDDYAVAHRGFSNLSRCLALARLKPRTMVHDHRLVGGGIGCAHRLRGGGSRCPQGTNALRSPNSATEQVGHGGGENTSRTPATEIATELGSTGRDQTGCRTFQDPGSLDNPPRFGIARYALERSRTNM